MGVIKTYRWIERYVKGLEEGTQGFEQQKKIFIKPLKHLFATENETELQHRLIGLGLFKPSASVKELTSLLDSTCWTMAQAHFNVLKEKWEGPDIPIYLLPAVSNHRWLDEELGGKMGVSFGSGIVLFVQPTVSEKDLQALLTHEYHHVCRLDFTGETERSIPLLESMVMEGLAELAVLEEVGSESIASWTSRYDHMWREEWYTNWLYPRLHIQGRTYYSHYLFGNEQAGIPRWLGYYFGFQLCKAAMASEEKTVKEWLRQPAKEILKKAGRT
ncbi:DUF2268 domain-containing protein [Shouchella shacheensis]|uniref:DUF2268 domain-containing protein n=1 Tax=Shouchella shacheensis TaxID=1649580 RepID=UPI0007404223|nr:DUF2268 domain-containing protein [Shouchella shacheensis]